MVKIAKLNPQRFVALSVGVGVAVPALWLFVYWVFLRSNPGLISLIMGTYHVDRALLAVWPSWIFLVADPEERSIAIPVVSVAVNAALYGALGWLFWFGLYRHRAILGVVIAVALSGWYFLFSWYTGW
jgi:hypothetical protein